MPWQSTAQVMPAAGVWLCTEHTSHVYATPLSHLILDRRVIFGGAAKKKK